MFSEDDDGEDDDDDGGDDGSCMVAVVVGALSRLLGLRTDQARGTIGFGLAPRDRCIVFQIRRSCPQQAAYLV